MACWKGVTANVIEPWLYGAHTGISSLAVLVTAIFWTVLWGPVGLVLSPPLTVCLVTLGRYVPQLGFLYVLLGDEPVLEPEAQVYQRLVAMDSVEARAIVDRFLKEKPLVEVYDSLLMPVLGLAEQDRHKGLLEPVRKQFVLLTIKEMLAEFSSLRDQQPPTRAVANSTARIICLPASDEADEIGAAMLAQSLEDAGHPAISFPAGMRVSELAGFLDSSCRDIVCVSAVPPFAFAHARTMCRKLRAKYRHITLIAGVWGFSGDTGQALGRFEESRPDKLITTLAQTVEFVNEACAVQPERV